MPVIRNGLGVSCTTGLTVRTAELVVGFCNQNPGFSRRETESVPATDVELVRGALDGTESAFREIVMRYQRPIYGLIARMVRDPGAGRGAGPGHVREGVPRAAHLRCAAEIFGLASDDCAPRGDRRAEKVLARHRAARAGDRGRRADARVCRYEGRDAGGARRAGRTRDGAADGDRAAEAGISRGRHAALRARARLRRDCGDNGTADGHGEELASSRAKRAGGTSGEPGMERDNPLDDLDRRRAAGALQERRCARAIAAISLPGRCVPSCARRCRPDERRFAIRWRRCSAGRPSSLPLRLRC